MKFDLTGPTGFRTMHQAHITRQAGPNLAKKIGRAYAKSYKAKNAAIAKQANAATWFQRIAAPR